MNTPQQTRPIDAIVWRKDLYPRFQPDPATIQQYAECIDMLPPIEINQRDELIDGYHRWTAHKKAGSETVPVFVTETASDNELLRLAIQRNATWGMQLTSEDKKTLALKLYAGDKEEVAHLLSVSLRTVSKWVEHVDRAMREERKKRVYDMWLACHTQDEIERETGEDRTVVARDMTELCDLEKLQKSTKLAALYDDAEWTPPLYDVWTFAKNTNATKHPGNTAVEIVDNLLYTFTQPFDIVVDPFGGGGATIDICKKRSRRYYVSDRAPVPERRDIRLADVTEGVPGPARWADVALVYLDPPYWKQVAGKYSDDPRDLANMALEQFNDALITLIRGYAARLSSGAHVAVIISPTQWLNDDKHTDYHDYDLVRAVDKFKSLRLVRRAVCPYSTEQYNGTQVNIAKRDKLWMVLSRTLLVWRRE